MRGICRPHPSAARLHRVRRIVGFSVLELLIVLAVLGIIGGIVAVSGRSILGGQQQRAAVNSVRQSVWEGATAAASRGASIELVRSGGTLELKDVASGAVIRTFEIPSSVTTNLPSGQVLLFTPPGRVDLTTLTNLPDPLTMTVNGRTFTLEVSVIGEVKVTS